MASILQFIPRSTSLHDWTDAERARLLEFASAMAEACGVRIDFGQTDEGDPWCVVLDDNDEVIVHIARIEGTFVAHAVAQDLVVQASELSTALDRALGGQSADRNDVVIPFPSNRASQIVTAVLVAAAFSWTSESRAEDRFAPMHVGEGGDDGAKVRRDTITIALPSDALSGVVRPSPLRAESDPTEAGPDGTFAVMPGIIGGSQSNIYVKTFTAPAGPSGIEATMPLPDEPAYFAGRMVDEEGDAPESPISAPSIQTTGHIVGTDGDDSLLVGSTMIVSGGAGADQFVVTVPMTTAGQSESLGTILDFMASEGDSIEFLVGTPHANVSIVSIEAVADVLPAAAPSEAPVSGIRVGIDLNADGREDGFLLLGNVSEQDAEDALGFKLPTSTMEPAEILEPDKPAAPPLEARPERDVTAPANLPEADGAATSPVEDTQSVFDIMPGDGAVAGEDATVAALSHLSLSPPLEASVFTG